MVATQTGFLSDAETLRVRKDQVTMAGDINQMTGQMVRPPPGEIWTCEVCGRAVCGEGNVGISPDALCRCAYPRPSKPTTQHNQTTRLYRPSNGSEGYWFMAKWCDRCVKDNESRPCRILGRTMALGVDDPQYPREWVEDDGGPRCTAFSDHVKAPLSIIRDKRQEALNV